MPGSFMQRTSFLKAAKARAGDEREEFARCIFGFPNFSGTVQVSKKSGRLTSRILSILGHYLPCLAQASRPWRRPGRAPLFSNFYVRSGIESSSSSCSKKLTMSMHGSFN
jgi:hypothetical protein